MNLQRPQTKKRGFTLVELLVAMAITTIIVTVLVSITSLAMDTWNRSRAELRAARQAKAMVDSMANDFEALVTRRGNTNEWLSAVSNAPTGSVNATKLIFFTAATDRYNGNIGLPTATPPDNGGDVSCVAYLLDYRDPIKTAAGGSGPTYETFVLNRLLVDPDQSFTKLLGVTSDTSTSSPNSLAKVFNDAYPIATITQSSSIVCENVFQFTVTFHVEVTQGTTLIDVPVTIGKSTSGNVTSSLTISGSKIDTTANPSGVSQPELKAGRVKSIEISLSVLSDFGVDMLRQTPSRAGDPKFLAKNSYQYSKRVQVPGM